MTNKVTNELFLNRELGVLAFNERVLAMAEDTSDKVLTLTVRPAASNAVSRWMEFLVTDVGPGIAPAVAEKLFTPFFTTKAEGMGLGLSLCRTVVEQHGGLLSHCDHTPRGTVFSFTLPQA